MRIIFNKIKNNNFLVFFLFLTIAGFFIFSFPADAAGPYDYTQLEPIPGSSATTGADLKTYIESIYKFAIWTVGIAAILMITIGGFMYLTSAGNTSKMDVAKKVVTDAVIGLVIVLTAYLVLYVINPDLVKITLSLKALKSGMSSTIMSSESNSASGKTCSDGKCSQVDSAISNNNKGLSPAIIKSILVGGEGCDKKLSKDGYGSCGYSQALPKIRAWCGITGSNTETCSKVQNDIQLDINCAAKLINDDFMKRCGSDIRNIASCYNSGKRNNCANTTKNYCDRVETYYNSCSK